MKLSRNDREHVLGLSLLSFVFLLVLILNALIFADIFLSIMESPLTLVFIRVVIMVTVLAFLLANSARHTEIQGRGWYFLISGFSLILLDGLIDLAIQHPLTRHLFQGISPSAQNLFKEIFCRLLGFFCLAYGFFLWIPSIIQARRRAEQNTLMLEKMVTERTRSLEEFNRQLHFSKVRLEEAVRLKNEFLASFSHELKTPLNSILGFCRLLREKRQGPLNEKQLRSIEIIDNNSKTLLDRITKILDYAKLEFEKVVPEYRNVKITELFAELTPVFEPQLKDKDIHLEVEVQGELKEVNTDRKIIGQLLQAVLDNAVKFTESGTVKLRSGLDRDNSRWWIAVSDTGPGIPGRELPYIFEPFRQGDGSLSRRYGGTGLGLTIARKLSRLLGGQIDVKSTVDSGSVFTFSFPLGPPSPLSRAAETYDKGSIRNEETR